MPAFIASQRESRGIPHAVSCRALEVSESWFYKWKDGDHSARRARRERLKAEVRRLFAEHKGKRGSPMITADLRDLGWRVSKNTVAAVMAEMGLAARPKKKRKGTTRPQVVDGPGLSVLRSSCRNSARRCLICSASALGPVNPRR